MAAHAVITPVASAPQASPAFVRLALYLGRLIVLNAASPVILVPAIVNGFLLQPAWYMWLGLALWRRTAAS